MIIFWENNQSEIFTSQPNHYILFREEEKASEGGRREGKVERREGREGRRRGTIC